jgi:glyoxylase-like metal-dependent hydrolase (beta-lactamase superfamily II)
MHIQSFVISPIRSNCYVLAEDDVPGAEAVIIDPGDVNLEPVFQYIDAHQFRVVAIWCTHGHFDHMLGVDVARSRYAVPVYMHKADLVVWDQAPEVTAKWLGLHIEPIGHPDRYWDEGDVVQVGRTSWTIWHTPGHSPGSVCILGDGHAFTGDTLFAGTIGRTDFPTSDPAAMSESLRRLRTWDDAIVIYPGHGPESTIREEKLHNPFLASEF